MWYVIDKEDRVVATCNRQPDIKDLESRERRAIESDLNLPLREAEFSNGKIRKKKVTKAEKVRRQRDEKKVIQGRIVDLRLRKKEAQAAKFEELVQDYDEQIKTLTDQLEGNDYDV